MVLALTSESGVDGSWVELLTGSNNNPLRARLTTVGPGILTPGNRGDEVRTWWTGTALAAAWLPGGGGTVYLSDYLPRTVGNNIQRALQLALAENPTATVFEFPDAVFELTEQDNFIGLRSNIWLKGNNTRFRANMTTFGAGVFFFQWVDTAGPYTNIRISGFRCNSYNQPATVFGCQFFIAYNATGVSVTDCSFECEAFTTFGTKAGIAFPGGARVEVTDCVFVRAQLALTQCSSSQATNNLFVDCNDFGISCVGVTTASIRRISICDNVFQGCGGSGCIFVGSDGAGAPTALDELEDINICDNVIGGVWGGYYPQTATAILLDSAVITRRVRISGNVIGRDDSDAATSAFGIRLLSNVLEATVEDVAICDNVVGRLGAAGQSIEGLLIEWRVDRLTVSDNVLHDNRGADIRDCRFARITGNTFDNGIVTGSNAFRMRATNRSITHCLISDNIMRPTTPGFPISFILNGPNDIAATFDQNTTFEQPQSLPAGGVFALRLIDNNFVNGLDAGTIAAVVFGRDNINYPL